MCRLYGFGVSGSRDGGFDVLTSWAFTAFVFSPGFQGSEPFGFPSCQGVRAL